MTEVEIVGDRGLEARYRSTDMEDPVLLSTAEDVDRLVDALLTGPLWHDAAHLLSTARTRRWVGPPGHELYVPDHELYVGVDRDDLTGALALALPEGHVASAGGPGSRRQVVHHVAGHPTEFPDDSEIPLALVRAAVKEFLSSGGRLPTCIAWKPFDIPGDGAEDEDPWASHDDADRRG
ncbi:Imm1 family immunity protein [Streptomyces sp. NRRL B-24484]|uniref:Imm1 family immunity protein n=1 Tax=Streptomyces sp. NRRL B-24484 TaxID=1463833 RepID=UPI0004C16931|nr:Imm1 family immunity protein [Streptomyces sp. NRRL B-24484]